jgi:hypothetical protein
VAGLRAITLSPYNIDQRLSPFRQVGDKANSDKCGNGKRRVISGKKAKYTEIQLIQLDCRETIERGMASKVADITWAKATRG